MKARYGRPDGALFDANEIHADDPKKSGPWYCATVGCSVQFKNHRLAAYALHEPGRVIRSGTFVHGADRAHPPTCSLNEMAMRQRLLAAYPSALAFDGDRLLLKWGDGPRVDKPSRDPALAVHTVSTDTRYAAIVKAAVDIARVIEDSAYDEIVLKRYWIVHNGTKLTWTQFCYGPDGDDLHRIIPSLRAAFNSTSAPWPRLVRAIVSDAAAVSAGNVLLNLRAPTLRANGDYVRLKVFAKAGTEEAESLLRFTPMQQIFVLGDNWGFLPDSESPRIWLSRPEQVSD